MRTMTRKEKLDEAIKAIKKAFTLLVLTFIMIILLALGASLGMERKHNQDLQHQIVELENKKSSEDINAKYDIIYVERR